MAALLIGIAAAPHTAHAVILNYGVDLHSNSLPTKGPFYSGDSNGRNVDPLDSRTISFDATSILTGYTINSATLFIDAEDIGSSDNMDVFVQNIQMADLFSNTPGGLSGCSSSEPVNSQSRIPCIGGGTAKSSDDDNSFYLLNLFQRNTLATDSTYVVEIVNNDTQKTIRIDGINIQVDATRLEALPIIPEPTSLLLFGVGGLLAGVGRRHRKNCILGSSIEHATV